MIHKLLTWKATAIPIFLAVMGCVFYLTFNAAGRFLGDVLSFSVNGAAEAFTFILTRLDAPELLASLLVDGIWAGVGSVLSFVPVIATLFFLLSLLEESGYLSSVASVLDGPMARIGLSGRCVVPMISGFGCSVPAVLAAGSITDSPGQSHHCLPHTFHVVQRQTAHIFHVLRSLLQRLSPIGNCRHLWYRHRSRITLRTCHKTSPSDGAPRIHLFPNSFGWFLSPKTHERQHLRQ